MNGTSRRRAAALLEVLGIYLAGPLAMFGVRRLLGISLSNPLSSLTAQVSDAGLIAASRQLFALLLFQYAGYFMLAVPLNWWHRRRRAADYGLTTAGKPWAALVLMGFATASLCELPVLAIVVANLIHPNPTEPFRQAMMDMSYKRWQFWLFSAVSSWAVIPFFEELFYRGYCQRRLAEDWGNGPAILAASSLFTFTHAQYLRADAYNAGMILGLLLSAIGFGVIFAWTRSLLPSIIAHALFDIPMTALWQGLLLASLLIVALCTWRRGGAVLKQVFLKARSATCLALGAAGAGYAILASRDILAVYALAAIMAILAVIIEATDRPGQSAKRVSA
jgi:membrane protease YdiL (CAAX protease family)